MKVLNLFTGISAPSVAWAELGWETGAFAEVDPAACSVLAHHYPGVPNLGDVSSIHPPADVYGLVVGGPPCQPYSVAGLRGGLDDPRGNMAVEYFRVVRESRARFMVFENVPGLLSSGGGDDFAVLLGLGSGWDIRCPAGGWRNSGVVPPRGPGDYGLAWRVLNAEHFGVPQRRRRVFVVGCLGDWRGAVAVLFERHGLSGNPPPGRTEGARVAPSVTPGARRASGQRSGEQLTVSGGGSPDELEAVPCLTRHGQRLDFDTEAFVTGPTVEGHVPETVTAVRHHNGKGVDSDCTMTLIADTLKGHHPRHREDDTYIAGPTHTLRADGFDASEDGTGRGTPLVPCDLPIPIDMRQASRGATMTNNRAEGSSGGAPGTGIGEAGDPSPSLSLSHPPAVAYQCHGSNVGEMGTLRKGDGGTTSGVPFIVDGPATFNVQAQYSEGNGPHARPDDVSKCLDSHGLNPDCQQGGTVVVDKVSNTLEQQANTFSERRAYDANALEAYAREVLRALRSQVGEEAFEEWGLGVLASLLTPEVLRSLVHGRRFRCPTDDLDAFVGDRPSPCQEGSPAGAVRTVWRAGRDRRASPQWGLDGQHAAQLGACLSRLSQQGTSPGWFLQGLREASEGLGVLRQALSAVQEVWRPVDRQAQPAHAGYGVRRLTPLEAERLQGFPDNWTLVPYRGKPMADGSRYKMIGNSMAVPCMRWIGRRIQMVDDILTGRTATPAPTGDSP